MWLSKCYSRLLLQSPFSPQIVFCRHYGYVHIPKKKPPHILGPGFIWRKCFVVRPTTETTNPLTKHLWLTKSVMMHDLPDAILNHPPPEGAVLEDFEERVCDFMAYQVRKPFLGRGPFSPDTVSGLLQSCLSSVWPMAKDFRHLRSSHMTLKPKVECYWRRCGENYISQTEPAYIMHTNMALGLFSDSTFAGNDDLEIKKYSPLHLGFFRHTFDQILPFGGSQTYSPLSMAHTVFMINRKDFQPDNLYTHGLVELFSQSAAEAVQNGFKIDSDLPYPLVTQGIITNGQMFTFMCFQLNTLKMLSDSEGDKYNIFWAGPILDLFDDVEVGEGMKNYNPECAELILKFLLHEPIRKRLRQFGGRSRAMPLHKIETDGQQLSPVSSEERERIHNKLNGIVEEEEDDNEDDDDDDNEDDDGTDGSHSVAHV